LGRGGALQEMSGNHTFVSKEEKGKAACALDRRGSFAFKELRQICRKMEC